MSSSRPSFMRRIAPAVLLGTSAVAIVALFDPALHSGGSDALASSPLPAAGTSSTAATDSASGTSTSGTKSKSNSGTSDSGTNSSNSGTSNTDSSKSNSNSNATSGSCDNPQVIDGDTIQTRYGPVQAEAQVSNGKVCSYTVIQYPQNDPRSSQISAQVVPWLEQASTAQGADFQHVTGATYTSEGYRQSVQSILDQL